MTDALVAGVDLAASAPTTGVAVLAGPTVVSLHVGVEDDELLALTRDASTVGLDCPLGWPRAFVAFVAAHERGGEVAPAGSIEERLPLVYRATDLHCRALGMRPLSVSADRIGHAALRAAALLPRLDAGGDRSGSGRVVETYPAGSLRRWGLLSSGYKGTAHRPSLAELAAIVISRVGLRFADDTGAELFATTDHAFDAVIAALTARATARGLTDPVPPDMREIARVEGWIALPAADSLDLLG